MRQFAHEFVGGDAGNLLQLGDHPAVQVRGGRRLAVQCVGDDAAEKDARHAFGNAFACGEIHACDKRAGAADNVAREFDGQVRGANADAVVVHDFHQRDFLHAQNALLRLVVIDENHAVGRRGVDALLEDGAEESLLRIDDRDDILQSAENPGGHLGDTVFRVENCRRKAKSI